MARQLSAGGMSATAIASAPPTEGFALAQAGDDAELRTLLRQSVIPGAVHVAFTREPDYFAGEGLAGAVDRTLGYRQEGALIGVARLSTHTLHRNGIPARIGYFGELRLSPHATHGARLLRDGYARLREYVHADALDGCFTSIAVDNHRARRVLESGKRFGLPAYTPIADLVTVLLPVSHSRVTRMMQNDALTATRDELSAFFNRHAAEAQLTLTWDDARWRALAVHGIDAHTFCVVRRGTEIVAAAAVWDQRAFRQTVVVRYEGALRWSRPVVNLLARAGLAPTLPREGSVLAQGAVFGATVADRTHWPALLHTLRADAARRGLQWLVIVRGVHDTELAPLRASGRTREYHTRLYDVRWPDMPNLAERWDTGRPFRPEVGLL